MAYSSFEELEVWRRGCRITIEIHQALRDCREFGMRDQMLRAAVSIPSNIAEGHERDSRLDFIRFLNIAKGSCAELRTQVILAHQMDILNEQESIRFGAELREISAMLHGLVKSLNPET